MFACKPTLNFVLRNILGRLLSFEYQLEEVNGHEILNNNESQQNINSIQRENFVK